MGVYRLEYFSKDVKALVQPTVSSIRGRYDTKVRLRREDGNLQVRPLSRSDVVAEKTAQDVIHEVLPYEDQRPDLTALNYYGDARLYWVILAANDLKAKNEYVNGMIVRIPSATTLYSKGGVLG
jgi:hypothetical protein